MNKIAIYGAGAFGRLFYKSLSHVDYFVDDFTTLNSYNGTPFIKLNKLAKNSIIYISILQQSKEIEKKLHQLGFTNIINFTNAIKTIPNILQAIAKTNYLWLVNGKDKMIDIKQLRKFDTLLCDKKSKAILNDIINLRKTLNPKYYIDPSDIEYFPSDIPILRSLEKINFIDCGAYTGDTIEQLIKQTQNVNYTLSFEPDNKNFIALQNQLEILKQKHSMINFLSYPAGVYSKNGVLYFANNGIDSSASFDDTSTLKVPVVTLDSVILHSSPNFIKMDIEGAEKEAIIGASQTIQKYKPNLAICLYHKPEDLWELPLLINSIEPSYNMYLRVHEDLCLSTILYCITKEQINV